MATHIETNQKVAIKMLRSEKITNKAKGADIMMQEHARMSLIQGHPNILQSLYTNTTGVLDSEGTQSEVMYNVLELAENGNFSFIIKNTGGLGEDVAKFHFLQI